MYGEDLLKAAETGNLKEIKELLDSGVNIETTNNSGNTALHLASMYGHLDAVKELLKAGANIEAKDDNGNTVLHYASNYDYLVKYLIEKGADIEAVDDNDWTTLHKASWDGIISVIEYLLSKGANIEATTNNGRTPLMLASQNGQIESLKYLIKKNANIDLFTLSRYPSIVMPEIHKIVNMKDTWSSVLIYIIQEKPKYTDRKFKQNISAFLNYLPLMAHSMPEIPKELYVILNTLI